MKDKIIDVTGIELTPGDPERCKGNGKEDPMACCCDGCDYFLACYPEWYKQEQEPGTCVARHTPGKGGQAPLTPGL